MNDPAAPGPDRFPYLKAEDVSCEASSAFTSPSADPAGPPPFLRALLAAREERTELRRIIAAGGRVSVSLTFNIPGWPKSEPRISRLFTRVRRDLTRHFAAHRLPLDLDAAQMMTDAAGDFFLAPVATTTPQGEAAKTVAEDFEQTHPLGRLLDVDVTGIDGIPISSWRAKPCLLCPDQPAAVCSRTNAHPLTELREEVLVRAERFETTARRRDICRILTACASRAALYEVAHTPKPGLVDRLGSGCHRDMDFFTFIDSTAALGSGFWALAEAGYDSAGSEPTELWPKLRCIGLEMEEAMFAATGGANTHKGLIFLLGLALFGAGRSFGETGGWDVDRFRATIRRLTAGLVERELAGADTPPASHGELAFHHFGPHIAGGARAEAEAGFPTAFEVGLPALRAAAPDGLPHRDDGRLQRALEETFFAILAVNADTNLLHRGGLAGLEGVRKRAVDVRSATCEAERLAAQAKLFGFIQEHRLSPGGSADLLAVTLFIAFIEGAVRNGL